MRHSEADQRKKSACVEKKSLGGRKRKKRSNGRLYAHPNVQKPYQKPPKSGISTAKDMLWIY